MANLADLYPRVYVVGGGYPYIKMFFDEGFVGARSVEDADIVCFTGGEDVSPVYYGERLLAKTSCNPLRDAEEFAVWEEAEALGRPKVGICRGAQFLNVMNGGKLWQDVNNHTAQHEVKIVSTGEIIGQQTSTHHQMMRPSDSGEVLAVACEATYKHAESTLETREEPGWDDVEAVWYPDTQSLCFQPHPEHLEGPCRRLFFNLIDDYIWGAA